VGKGVHWSWTSLCISKCEIEMKVMQSSP
jgi:hypothetical protein